MTALRIAFAGTPEFAVPALHALLRSPHRVVGVLTQPDRPRGRGRKLAGSAVKEAALSSKLPVAQPASLKGEADRTLLAEWMPDVLVVVAYGPILPQSVLSLPRLGCLNIHASLLPRWRGAAPIQRAILAGDAETGVTIMQMDAGLDTGPILLQRRVMIGAHDTSGTLHERLSEIGAEALIEALHGIVAGTLSTQPQSADGMSYAAKIQKSEALIDWSEDAATIDRKVRAFHPSPCAETRFRGEQLRILKAYLPDSVPDRPVASQIDSSVSQSGTAYSMREGAVLVRCGHGDLAVTMLQRPGKRPVSARDFVHAANLLGQRLG